MSGDLTVNKILGAVLATGLAVVGLHEVAGMSFEPKHIEPDEWGWQVEAALPDAGGGPEPELPVDWGTVLPVADIAAGEVVFNKCTSCHKTDATNGTGPGLVNAVGRAPASHAGFAYSAALQAYAAEHSQWTYDELDAFLKAPGRHVPGTKMTFVGLKNQPDRINVIAYLRQFGSALPIPAPDPSRQPQPEGEAPAEDAAPANGEAAPAEAAPAEAK